MYGSSQGTGELFEIMSQGRRPLGAIEDLEYTCEGWRFMSVLGWQAASCIMTGSGSGDVEMFPNAVLRDVEYVIRYRL